MGNSSVRVKKAAFVLASLISLALAFSLLLLSPVPAHAATNKKVAIVYFSATGTTKAVAKKIQKATKGTLVQIKASKPYTRKDLDYTNDNSRANKEQGSATPINKSKIRPAIKNISAIKKAVKNAKIVYIGYPIWWGEAPLITYTMIEKVSLKGKTVVPFCTSGSSGIGASARHLKKCAIISSNTKWKSGKSFYGTSTQAAVNKWTKKIK